MGETWGGSAAAEEKKLENITIFGFNSTIMAVYEYEHIGAPCKLGSVFEVTQSISDSPLAQCPGCQAPVRKLISRININTPKSNSELRDLGFTKLVKRDDGVYENVTKRDGDSRYMLRDKPETIPDLTKTIKD